MWILLDDFFRKLVLFFFPIHLSFINLLIVTVFCLVQLLFVLRALRCDFFGIDLVLNVVSELGIHVFLHVLAHIFYKLFAALRQKCEQMLSVSRSDDRILRERHDAIRIDLA